MKERTLLDYLEDIERAIEAIGDFVDGISYEDFEKDLKTQYAVLKAIEIIGEATRKIPDDFRKKHSEVPWKEVVGMRDKLVHDYMGVDLQTVWDTATKNIPPLKNKIQELI